MNKDPWRYREHGFHPDTLREFYQAMMSGGFERTKHHKAGPTCSFGYAPNLVGCRLALKTLQECRPNMTWKYHYALFKRPHIDSDDIPHSHKLVVGVSRSAILEIIEKHSNSRCLKLVEWQ